MISLSHVSCACLAFSLVAVATASKLPEVDLGYSTYKATTFNVGSTFLVFMQGDRPGYLNLSSGKYFTFSNIRFAAPPVGELRFRAPAPPIVNRSAVIDGSLGYICPQSQPGWWTTTFQVLGNLTKAIPAAPELQQQNEDCLFLDVVAPANKFKNGQLKENVTESPVLIWIHGGGYFIGGKTTLYDPAGFFHESHDDIVYMSMNYRLSSLGFLSGTNETGNVTSPNAGLLDQRASFEWVKKYIHLFGGNADNITIFGQSAGGGSVMHHTTWLAGKNKTENKLIKRALAQSPVPNVVSKPQQRKSFNALLEAANVSSVDELRQLPPNSSVLLKANAMVEETAAFTTLNFGPWVDGYYVPDFPSKCYPEGKFIKSLEIMAGHNNNDGILFTPRNYTDATYEDFLKTTFPYSPQSAIDHISQVLYPAVYDGSQPYSNALERLTLTVGEQHVICNPYFLALGYKNKTHNYIFSVPPALHAEDLSYSFFDGSADQVPPTNLTVGQDLNGYITHFALSGNPNSPGRPKFPKYGGQATALNLTIDGLVPVKDPTANARCDWWALGLVYGGQY